MNNLWQKVEELKNGLKKEKLENSSIKEKLILSQELGFF